MPDEEKAQPKLERGENFISSYANSIGYEASAWDLKVIFGQIDQSSGATVVKQHLAVTIPWAQAKLTLFWLGMQVALMEEQTGKIPVRRDIIPPEPPPLTTEQENDPAAKRFHEAYLTARARFLASL